MIDLLKLTDKVAAELMAIEPKDVQSRRKIVRGHLIGDAEYLAAEGQLYPVLEWESRTASVTRDGSAFHFKESDKVTVRTNPNVTFQLDQLLIYGRVKEGHVPVELDKSTAFTRPTPESKSARLLKAIIPLVNTATASMPQSPQGFPHVLAFNLFGQGVASFEAAQLLINDRRPVEALPALRNLAVIASRFEQMADENGPGIGIALRMALETLQELGADEEISGTYRDQILSGAESAGISVPAHLPAPEGSAIYLALRFEMQLADSAANGTYAAIWPHLKHEDANHSNFYTQVEPGAFTELIASACVIAQLQLLGSAAQIFSWTINQQELQTLLVEARELNEASANSQIR